MGDSLDASLLSRLRHGWRPDWSRTVLARRIAAGALVVLAAIAALRPDPSAQQAPVVVAAHDLAPGVELTADDIAIESRSATTIPEGSTTTVDSLVGATLAGPARRGEVLTDVRVLGPRLARATAGPEARIVPLHLADAALLDLLRPGDVVDVLAGADNSVDQTTQRPEVLATDAHVILVSDRLKAPTNRADRVVLVALPRHTANTVAGAALSRSITLTLH
ncbi:MAG: SAF domain-containing protein [Mycobacterium sp.]